MTRWIFLRHGESTANAARVFSGQEDVALTTRGQTQADAAGPLIDALLGEHPLARALSSDLSRARETADRALETCSGASDIALQCHADLRERHLGEWQGQSIDELIATGARKVLLRWAGRPPGGESLADLASRALPCLEGLEGPGPILLVSHGGVIRALLGLVDGIPLADIGRNNIPNATPIAREIEDGTWSDLASRLANMG